MTEIIVLADGAVGEACVRWLLDHHKTDLALVVTVAENSIWQKATDAGTRTHVFKTSEQLMRVTGDLGIRPEIGLLLWWPKIIKQPLLSLPRRGFVNTHPSLLPFNRGKHYSFWSIVEQAPFGVTLHFVDEGVDTGDIIFQRSIETGWTDTGRSLFEKAQNEMTSLFKASYCDIKAGNYKRRPQPKEAGSFHTADEIGLATAIDLDRDYRARDLLNLLRAKTFEGLPGCTFSDAGRTYDIRVRIEEQDNET